MLAGIYVLRGRNRANQATRVRRVADATPQAKVWANERLAVVSGGAPSPDGDTARCALAGSIYNLAALAGALGAPISLGSDALLTRGFERWGDDLLPRLRGTFALAIWNADASRILIAQDQVGSGAIFLLESAGELLFASELHYLVALAPRTPEPDEVAVVRRLATAPLYDGQTMFTGVRRLGAGRRVSVTAGRVEEASYWAPRYEPPWEGSRVELAARFRDALTGAVRQRIAGVKDVGITFSGGFDSSAVAAVAASVKEPSQTLHAYSTVFPRDPDMDDRDLLDALVQELPVRNIRFQVEPGGMLRICLEYLRDWRLPLSGPGWVVERPFMQRAAANGVAVMLDGQGGDELFGLSAYLLADRLRSGRVLSAIDLARHRFPGAGAGAPWKAVMHILKAYGLRGALPHRAYVWQRRLRDASPIGPAFLGAAAQSILSETTDELRWAKSGGAPRWWLYLRHLLIEGREGTGLGDYVRQRSRWVGVEGRPPLFDVDLIDAALRLPPELAFDPYLDRPLAREAMAGLLPDTVRLSRRKSNLFPFYYDGLTGRDLPMARALLAGDRLEIERWADRGVVQGLLDNPPGPESPAVYGWLSALWSCVTMESWLRSLADPGYADRMLERSELAQLEHSEIE